jgi:PTH1 family peptidyl-tRNA hydrolase
MNDGPKNEYLIVGLGNPGKKYAMSRHNVGFMAVDAIASYLKADFRASNSFSGEVAKFSDKKSGIDGYILKPTTFMNLSGEAVRPLADYYKIPPSNILVIFDDVDIPFGRVRIKANGSGGGHNGMLSIILNLNSDQFPRVRVGVGRPQNPEREQIL